MLLVLALWAWLLPLFSVTIPTAAIRPPDALADLQPSPDPSRPPATAPHGDRRRKVLLIGIDGLRPDALLSARAPRLRGLISEGAFASHASADRITRSGPGWASILTGVWHDKHNVVDNDIRDFHGNKYPAFFSRLKEKRPGLRTAAIVNWAPIREKLISGADYATATGNDEAVASQASALLRAGDPDVVFLEFDAPDHAGHEYGFSRFSPAYARAIRKVDRLVGKLLDDIEARPERAGEDWLVVCTTDHGGSWRHHGKDIPAHRRVFLIVSGSRTKQGERIQGASLVDVAPTISAFLGISPDRAWGWEGRPVGLR